MEHEAYVAVVRSESERLLEVLATTPPDAPVPACAGWSAADLLWHVGEVQHFWAGVVGEGLDADGVATPDRPPAADLGRYAAEQGTALVTALARRSPDEPCYSWHQDGGSVGWVARRQAHEALIHRVDAEQTAGLAVRPPTVALAADGVDEVLRVMVDGVPGWGTFTPDGVRVDLVATSGEGAAWSLALGRFTGTSPSTGRVYDLDAASLVAGSVLTGEADVTLAGTAWGLDLWLWGRGGSEELEVRGDGAVVERFRALVAEATQ